MTGLPEATEMAGSGADREQRLQKPGEGGPEGADSPCDQQVIRYPSSSPCRCHLPKARPGWGLGYGSLQFPTPSLSAGYLQRIP